MLALLGTTITASFVDSLNPSAIAQQMLLQAMVKNKRHTLYFIFGIGLANYLLGLAVYYGITEWVTKLFSKLTASYPVYVYTAEIAAGFLCAAVGTALIFKTRRAALQPAENNVKTPASLAPFSLFIMGAAFCAVELTSALPYFGFLAMLASYDLSIPAVLVFICIYDFIYILPLLILYRGYNKLQGTTVIKRLEKILSKVSSYVVPVVLCILGIFLLYKGISALL